MMWTCRAFALLAAGAYLATNLAAQTPLTTVLYTNEVVRPVQATGAPGDLTRLFVIEQHQGDVEIIIDGVKNPAPFLDLAFAGIGVALGNEQGLLGIAFHPDYETNGLFFLNYTAAGTGNTKIRRFTVSGNPDLADTGSGVEIMNISQPQSNHNGGGIHFGPMDQMLYISTGDGGGGNDGHGTIGNGQSLTTLLGKILRISPNLDANPSAPFFTGLANNPFFGGGAQQNLIWAYGLRNPFRFSLDSANGDMWIGDVGQEPFSAVGREEVDYAPATDGGGENYGWRCMEGNFSTGLSGCTPFSPSLSDPIIDFPYGGGNGQGRSVIGGFVYRGDVIPDLQGAYFYGDNSSNNIWTLDDGGASVSATVRDNELAPSSGGPISAISGWGEDTAGELYITALGGGGKVFKIVPDTPFMGLGCATEGGTGTPVLFGTGPLTVGSSGSLNLRNANPSSITLLLVSLSEGSIPFFGGTLKTGLPWLGEFFLNTNGAGEVTLPWGSWPSGVPSDTEIYFQWAIDDPAGIGNVALSNALMAEQP